MRLVRAVLLVALASSLAAADGSKVPLRLVRVLPQTHQALLLDRTRDTHVLVDLGGTIDGYTVQDIAPDAVTLSSTDGQVILEAPDHSWRHKNGLRTSDFGPRPETAPQDPYADVPVRVVEAPHPIEAGDGGVRVAEAPDATPKVATVTLAALPADPVPVPVAVAVAVPVAVPVPVADAAPTAVTLPRAQLDASLSNFARLTASIHGAFTPDGVHLDSLTPDSLFAQVGLRAGDTIVSVDGRPLRTLDDAASLYARASTTRSITVHVLRAGKPLDLRLAIN
jgi:hypothetical protein